MYLCFLHNISAQSIFLPLSIHSAVWFFFPCLGERSCIVGVCCLSARAKIDSKLQSLLRTPHCAAWPQNNTHRHIPTDLHTNVNYTVCCPTSLFPMQPVDVTITQNPLQLCANQQSCTRVMCLQRKLWVWFTDVNAIMASSQLTLTHKHTFKSIYADLYTFYCQSITKCSHKTHSNKIIFCVDFVDELNKLINSQTTLVSSISSKIKIKTPQKQKNRAVLIEHHRCLSYSPWESQNRQWLCHFPLDSSWQGGRTCTHCLVVNKFLSGIPDKPPVSATLCPGSVSHSPPF